MRCIIFQTIFSGMVNETIIGIASAAGGATVIFFGGRIFRYIARRIRVSSPEAETLAQVVPAVNALIKIQGPQTDALIALLEASKGQCNGNVDRALEVARRGREDFIGFLRDSARVEIPS
ncbi:hypothetical protein CCP3SC15_5800001 [Gammaproteobacteria bacterium]